MKKYFLFVLILILLLLSGCGSISLPVPPDARPAEAQVEMPAVTECPDAGKLRFSELMTDNLATLLSENAFPCWAELENVSDSPVSLAGWSLCCGSASFSLSDEVIEPHGFFTVVGFDKELMSASGEELLLMAPGSTVSDCAVLPVLSADESYARSEDGQFCVTSMPTPGYSNTSEGFEAMCSSANAAGPLVINEVMVYNDSYLQQNNGEFYDWVEIKNISSEAVSLGSYYLSDDNRNFLEYRLPDSVLYPGEVTVILCSDDVTYGAPFSLNAEKEQLYLSDGEAKAVVDYVNLRAIPYGMSFGRSLEQNGFFYLSYPTPWYDNYSAAYRRIASAPECPAGCGVYNDIDSFTVKLYAPGEIHYTTDGSVPGYYSPLYSEPIHLSETAVIRAIAYEEGALPSPVVTLPYIINEDHELPVMMLSTDSPSDFEYIYSYSKKDCEIKANLSFFESGGSFSVDCDLEMKGWTSLEYAKKNFGVYFRPYYGDGTLEYDIFDSDVCEFSSLSIRAGQDFISTVIRNEFLQELCLEMSDKVPVQQSKICVLYVNGSYWGIYTLKENVNEAFYASHFGKSEENVVSVRSPYSMSSAFKTEVADFVLNRDMSDPDNYAYFCSLMDVDSLIDWMLLESFASNSDVKGNMRYFKATDGDGLWRIALYDLDWAYYNLYNCVYNVMSPKSVGQIPQIIYSLERNPDFRDAVLRRYAELVKTTLSEENVLAVLERFELLVRSEIPRDRARWGFNPASWQKGIDALKYTLSDGYIEMSIKRLCSVLKATDEQRAYFD